MKELGVFITQLHPFDSTSLLLVNHLLMKERREFQVENVPEVPFLQRQIPPLLNGIQKRDNQFDVLNGNFKSGYLRLPSFESISKGFKLGSKKFGCILLGEEAIQTADN
jgi:hypothetical protein